MRPSLPRSNQRRLQLDLHTAAYWLRVTVPKTHALAKAQFATLRIRLLKIAARIRETAHRARIAFAAACPDAALLRQPAIGLRPPAGLINGAKPPIHHSIVSTPLGDQ